MLARGLDDAIAGANVVGYPVLFRPYVCAGGRAMEVIPDEISLRRYVANGSSPSRAPNPGLLPS